MLLVSREALCARDVVVEELDIRLEDSDLARCNEAEDLHSPVITDMEIPILVVDVDSTLRVANGIDVTLLCEPLSILVSPYPNFYRHVARIPLKTHQIISS